MFSLLLFSYTETERTRNLTITEATSANQMTDRRWGVNGGKIQTNFVTINIRNYIFASMQNFYYNNFENISSFGANRS